MKKNRKSPKWTETGAALDLKWCKCFVGVENVGTVL